MPDRRQPPRPTYDELVALVTAQAERTPSWKPSSWSCWSCGPPTRRCKPGWPSWSGGWPRTRPSPPGRRRRTGRASRHVPPAPASRAGDRRASSPAARAHLAWAAPGRRGGRPRARGLRRVWGEPAAGAGDRVAARQVADLPEVRLRVVEHRAERRRCDCGQITAAAFPPAARWRVCYGPRLRGLIAYLCCYRHLPMDRAGGCWPRCLARRLGRYRRRGRRRGRRRAGRLLCRGDRPAHRRGGRALRRDRHPRGRPLAWVHTACTDRLTLLTIHRKRQGRARGGRGPAPVRRVAVHDGWAPYRAYRQATHALCNAHHLRELDALAGWLAAMTRSWPPGARPSRPRRPPGRAAGPVARRRSPAGPAGGTVASGQRAAPESSKVEPLPMQRAVKPTQSCHHDGHMPARRCPSGGHRRR
jgi:Transposase IS66 family